MVATEGVTGKPVALFGDTLESLVQYEDMATKKAISLFSGCGGSDYALQELGYEIVWGNDVWQTACDTYKENIDGSNIECGDIRDFRSFQTADLLVGCYPCQGYTQGGKR